MLSRIDLKKEKIVRLSMAYTIIIVGLLAECWFIVNFSATYGWEHSSNCLWCFILSVGIQYGVYDVIITLIQQAIFKANTRVGTNLYNVRSLKWGTTQE
jgi:hypothetical protein